MKSVRLLMQGAACVAVLATSACASTPQYPVHEGEPMGGGGFTPLKPRYSTVAPDAAATRGVESSARPLAMAAAAPSPAAAVSAPVSSTVDEKAIEPPKPAPKPVPVPPPLRVIVKSGDTIYDIAARNRSPVRGIIDANNLTPPYTLQAGQTLTVPKPAVHFVLEGDTLYGVARRYNVDVHSLASLNDLTLQSRLRLGQPLSLPADARDSGPSPVVASTPSTAPSLPVSRPVPVRPTRPLPSPSSSPSQAPATVATAPVSEIPSGSADASVCSQAPTAAPRARRNGRTVAEAYAAVERSPTAIAPDTDPAAANEPPPTAQTPFEQAALAAGAGKFAWPAHGSILSTFGPKPSLAQNDGVDIGASYGSPVVATADGHVVFNGTVAGQGKTVLLKHYDDNWASVYGQLSRSLVKNEEKVRKGQVIGCVGQGVSVPQPQLHFELRYRPTPTEKHKPVNPLLILGKDE